MTAFNCSLFVTARNRERGT